MERRRMAPLSLAAVRARLADDQAILLLQQFPEELLTWYIRRDSVEVRPAACPEASVVAHIAGHRRAIAAGRGRDAASAALFECAIRPWTANLPSLTSLAVVPDAPWHRVAWPALWDRASGSDLIAGVDVVVAPSASLAVAGGRTIAATPHAGVLVVSATLGGDDLAPLPDAREEARAIARLHPGAHLIEGEAATPDAFTAALSNVQVIHVASHAKDMAAYPLLSHLVLGGPQRPLFARDIARLDLSHTTLVVLAACATAGQSSVRGEGSVGVAWSFLTAGTPRVIATLDEIADRSSSRLFIAIHGELARGATPAQAVGRVQRDFAARAESVRVWAAVTVLGAL
jgi:CHAT domain-containing protein